MTSWEIVKRNWPGGCSRSEDNVKSGQIEMVKEVVFQCMYGWYSIKLIPISNSTTEGSFIELKLRKKKWLLFCSFNPHRRFISNHLIDIERKLDLLSIKYNILLLGDFNTEVANHFLKEFCDLYGMKSLIRIPKCLEWKPGFSFHAIKTRQIQHVLTDVNKY